jgi:hypothetical protein
MSITFLCLTPFHLAISPNCIFPLLLHDALRHRKHPRLGFPAAATTLQVVLRRIARQRFQLWRSDRDVVQTALYFCARQVSFLLYVSKILLIEATQVSLPSEPSVALLMVSRLGDSSATRQPPVSLRKCMVRGFLLGTVP